RPECMPKLVNDPGIVNNKVGVAVIERIKTNKAVFTFWQWEAIHGSGLCAAQWQAFRIVLVETLANVVKGLHSAEARRAQGNFEIKGWLRCRANQGNHRC